MAAGGSDDDDGEVACVIHGVLFEIGQGRPIAADTVSLSKSVSAAGRADKGFDLYRLLSEERVQTDPAKALSHSAFFRRQDGI